MKNFILIFLLTFSFIFAQKGPSIQLKQKSPALLVETINISGNTKTKKDVIRNNIDFEEGDYISQDILQKSTLKLENTNFFKKVEVYTQPGSEKGHIAVYIEVKERKWPFFQFKGEYNELDGWYISPLGIRFDNILGKGNSYGIEMYFGYLTSGLDISWLHPRLMGSDWDLRLLVFGKTRFCFHYLQEKQYLQEIQNDGLSIRLNGSHGLYKYMMFEYSWETFSTGNKFYLAEDDSEKEPLPNQFIPYVEEHEVGRMVLSLYADTRDQKRYPMSGWWGSVGFNHVDEEFGAFDSYKSFTLDIRKYQKVYHKLVFAARFKAGKIDENAPFYEKFTLGGTNSVRGYDDQSLNPLGFATHLLMGNAELRFPLTQNKFPNHFLTGVIFADVGQAWHQPEKYHVNRFDPSIGYGLRIKSPIVGMLRLDFAHPINNDDFHIYLSLGHTF